MIEWSVERDGSGHPVYGDEVVWVLGALVGRRVLAGLVAVSDDEVGADGPTMLVGRARELEAIATAMATARRGTARVVHLVGEAGIGKTALAEQAALAAGQG